jgi:hypothetical protein
MRTIFVLSVLTLSLATVACASQGGVTTADAGDASARDGRPVGDASDGGVRDGARDTTAVDVAEPADAGEGGPPDAVSSGCPASPPLPYSPCSELELYCSWGTDPRFQCRARAECGAYLYPDGGTPSGLVWRSGTDDLGAQDCPTPPPSCPATPPPTLDGGSLDNPPCDASQAGLDCEYDGVAYTCAPCVGPTLCIESVGPGPDGGLSGGDGGYPYQWFRTELSPECPEGPPGGSALPNFGAPCSEPGLRCNYNQCASSEPGAAEWAVGVLLRCQDDGTWTELGSADAGACL